MRETIDESGHDLNAPRSQSDEDTLSNFHEFLPARAEGAKPCIFLELCAGSARLSAAVRSTGIPVVPIDHKHNRHAP